MNRSLFQYPNGAVGIAYALLRTSVGIAGLCVTTGAADLAKAAVWLLAFVIWAGAWTRLATTLLVLICAAYAVPALSAVAVGCLALPAVAIWLTGPGAYSVDGTWFGRRRIRLRD